MSGTDRSYLIKLIHPNNVNVPPILYDIVFKTTLTVEWLKIRLYSQRLLYSILLSKSFERMFVYDDAEIWD